MKLYMAGRLAQLLACVRAGEPVDERLLTACEKIIARELRIGKERGRRHGEYWIEREGLTGSDCRTDPAQGLRGPIVGGDDVESWGDVLPDDAEVTRIIETMQTDAAKSAADWTPEDDVLDQVRALLSGE